MEEVAPAGKSLGVEFVTNDLTNKSTTASSRLRLDQLDVRSAVLSYQATGIIILVSNQSKKLIRSISVAEPTNKIIGALREAENNP